ncbi:GSCFA domain-containing protein [Parabacteroides sp. AF17-28]|uniref:GSCFA domain-containing protein n=1 Tax=Parabacteroides sp. AF17-28 TaxID=2292241 RepID=UPI000EFDE86A|nr:GSCFA domain-containing protein [Parabacteroides sp. AF17-28]RHR53586.1 GSCFA domain protein [Parabacteroides sp. AF17-28]
MDLYTRISIPKAPFAFSYTEQTVLLGSCFAENIGKKLEENKFKTDLNPFGTLYNPSSIAEAIRMLLHPERFTGDDLFRHEGVYHSFSHHSRFSSPSETECLENINGRLFSSAEIIRKARRMIITLGTAWVYRLRSTGKIVSNCHKLPEKMFDRQMLSVDEITAEWKSILLSLWEQNPELKILFTVSPIRHWKDGAHGNQLSKATLLLAVEQLQKDFPEQTAYFPAYEIMMDELRDYRFYADDMLHPSLQAVEYIWERFTETMLSRETQAILKEWKDIQKAINHKPFQPESEAYKHFISQTLLKMERLNEKFPYFDMTNEIAVIKKKF